MLRIYYKYRFSVETKGQRYTSRRHTRNFWSNIWCWVFGRREEEGCFHFFEYAKTWEQIRVPSSSGKLIIGANLFIIGGVTSIDSNHQQKYDSNVLPNSLLNHCGTQWKDTDWDYYLRCFLSKHYVRFPFF